MPKWGALVGLLLSLGVDADSLYRWVDERGVTHFASQPPLNGQHRISREPIRETGNVALSDVQGQFVALARLSAPTLCGRRTAAGRDRYRCVDAQLAAARALGRHAYLNRDPQTRFEIQTCQVQYILDRHRPADFVAMRECVTAATGLDPAAAH